jgi:hypothetical protein
MGNDSFAVEEAVASEAHQGKLRALLERQRATLEAELGAYKDHPGQAPLETVSRLCRVDAQLASGHISALDTSPQQQLEILGAVEGWYIDRGAAHPNPTRLAEQRAFWQGRIDNPPEE